MPTLQEKAQDKDSSPSFAAIPTPTSAFNTAEIAEAAAQAAAKDPSGFSQVPTSPNALKVPVPGARLAGVPPLPNTLPPLDGPEHGRAGPAAVIVGAPHTSR